MEGIPLIIDFVERNERRGEGRGDRPRPPRQRRAA